MNERIKELAEQAGFSFKYKTAPDELNPGHKLQDLEKFAELIVRECLTICTSDVEARLNGAPYETASDFDKGFMDGQDCCYEEITKHFGVEE